jgi:hypothetical protein
MPPSDSSESRIEVEREILRALCATGIDPVDWNRFIARLVRHRWRAPEHRIVFEALRASRSRDATTRREQLPAQATRMGFPDVDWENYFGLDPAERAAIEGLLNNLEAID